MPRVFGKPTKLTKCSGVEQFGLNIVYACPTAAEVQNSTKIDFLDTGIVDFMQRPLMMM